MTLNRTHGTYPTEISWLNHIANGLLRQYFSFLNNIGDKQFSSSWRNGLSPCRSGYVRETGVGLCRSHIYLTVSRTLILLCKPSNAISRPFYFPHTSTLRHWARLRLFLYKTALYKFTVVIIIIIRPHRSRSAAAYRDQTFPRTICRSVRSSVRAWVSPVHCGKTADRIRMPFGIVGRTGPGMRPVLGFGDRSTGMGTFGGESGACSCNQWRLTFAATRPSSQITLGRLVIIINYLGRQTSCIYFSRLRSQRQSRQCDTIKYTS